MLFGLGVPEWVTIFALIGGLVLTFKLMARASIAYEKARQAKEQPKEQQRTDRKEDSE